MSREFLTSQAQNKVENVNIDADLLEQIDQNVRQDTMIIGKFFGHNAVEISPSDGWSVDPTNNWHMTYDPRFFIDKDYTTDMASDRCAHEWVHIFRLLNKPELTKRVMNFKKLGEAESVFHNIFDDIADNKTIHAMLPRYKTVEEELYRTKSFPDDNYLEEPRHLQFLYKIIRQEMIPDSETDVFPEVDDMIEKFRNFQNTGQDLIKYSTQYSKSPNEIMPLDEEFNIWTKVIYPEWKKLLKMDEQDPNFREPPKDDKELDNEGSNQENESGQSKQAESGESEENESGQSKQAESGESGESNNKSNQSSDNDEDGKPDFSQYYEKYQKNNPDLITEEQQKEIKKNIRQAAIQEKEHQRQEQAKRDPIYQLNEKIKNETGYSINDIEKYNRLVDKYREQIDELRDILRKTLNEHIGIRRRLISNHDEGAILTPEHLARTAVEIKMGKQDPKAFSDYEKRISNHELTGKTDFVFAFDCSGSMRGENAICAADSAIVCMEALAGMQRDIEEVQEQAGIIVDVDFRTAIYTFGDGFNLPKPLSHGLTTKERLETYNEIVHANGGLTSGGFFRDIKKIPIDHERKQILIVVTDGEFNSDFNQASVNQLVNNGWIGYCIGIGQTAIIDIFPNSGSRITDPADLPQKLQELIERNL